MDQRATKPLIIGNTKPSESTVVTYFDQLIEETWDLALTHESKVVRMIARGALRRLDRTLVNYEGDVVSKPDSPRGSK